MGTYYYNKKTFLDEIKEFLKPANTLIDVGCGVSPQRFITPKVHICLEPYKDYIDIVRGFCPSNADFVFMNVDGLTGLKCFADQSVDTVCLIDVIEHLEKCEGQRLLEEAVRTARNQVIVFTPLGFMPQYYAEGDKDAWGLNGIDYQQHKSGWELSDFDNNWEFHICQNFHSKETMHIEIDDDYGCFFAIRNINFDYFSKPSNIPDFVVHYAASDRKIKTGTIAVAESFNNYGIAIIKNIFVSLINKIKYGIR